MPKSIQSKQLVVEGPNDMHVVCHLCKKHSVQEIFKVITPSDGTSQGAEGITALINGLPLRLKQPGLKTLGIMIDADIDIMRRWEQIKGKLSNVNDYSYNDLPEKPEPQGVVRKYSDKPNIGIWIMPNNSECGMLEDFIKYLIPNNDKIVPKTKLYLESIENEQLNPYKSNHRSKAFIHAWLACQNNPGMPMGQAITANVLNHRADIANRFIDWLNNLFVRD